VPITAPSDGRAVTTLLQDCFGRVLPLMFAHAQAAALPLTVDDRRPRLGAPCVRVCARNVDAHVGLVTYNHCIVPWRNLDGVSRSDIHLFTTVHRDVHAARYAIAEVMRLAAIGPSDGLDAL
jgi:hypothetical protein